MFYLLTTEKSEEELEKGLGMEAGDLVVGLVDVCAWSKMALPGVKQHVPPVYQKRKMDMIGE